MEFCGWQILAFHVLIFLQQEANLLKFYRSQPEIKLFKTKFYTNISNS